MLHFLDKYRDINTLSVIIRMVMCMLCGGAIGLERSYKNRPAGLRTHILVCTGAAVASMTGIYLYVNMHLSTDIARLGAQVVSGLGFIGGGTILVTKKRQIRGLTTAAGLWATGIIGLALGAGFYEGAVITTVAVLLAETLLYHLTRRMAVMEEFKLLISYHGKQALDSVMRYCKDQKMDIVNLQIIGTFDMEISFFSATVTLKPRKEIDREGLIKRLREFDGIAAVDSAE